MLEARTDELICPQGHRYPVFDGVPVMLLDDIEVTHDYINQTLKQVSKDGAADLRVPNAETDKDHIDQFVQGEVPYTSGNLYFSVQHKLTRYPIPSIRLPPSQGERLLDIGGNWGRWSIAAARKGYRPVGLDPSLDAVLAARRVSRQLGVAADFVVGDARFLPFADDAFDTVFSYGVFQHFSKENVRTSLAEIVRVLKPQGMTLIQMPNRYGIRQYQQHRRRGFAEGEGFEVRYRSPSELVDTFQRTFGGTTLTTDCYFGLGIQASDADLLPFRYRMVVGSSELLRKLSHFVTPLTRMCLTGDDDSECRMLRTDDGFKTVHTVGEGDETWRAVSVLFDEAAMFYGMDAEFRSNHIYRLDRRTSDRTSLAEVQGTVYYSKGARRRDLERLDGFGTIHFPYANVRADALYFSVIGVKEDNQTFCIRRHRGSRAR